MIILATLNARYHHSSLALRCLLANMGELQDRSRLMEFTIAQHPRDIAETILEMNPRIVGFGVYIWNVRQTQEVIDILKQVRPELVVVLGGPEVSHDSESQEICQVADFTFQGEADLAFPEFCVDLLVREERPVLKCIACELPDVLQLKSPYAWVTEEDIKNRIIYVEASRGCPFQCDFCLSSMDPKVRAFDLDWFLGEMEILLERGVRQFKFLDRTFNLKFRDCQRILEFFLDRLISLDDSGEKLFIHFEMVPDRLPLGLRELIARFPEGSLQFEVGIQTFNSDVAKSIHRPQDNELIVSNLDWLRKNSGVHLHTDLIAGLPGEDMEGFASGFDRLLELNPHEIQVGILKSLKGTPLKVHHKPYEMEFQKVAPYQILKTRDVSFSELQAIHRFSKFWDLIGNSGNFSETLEAMKLHCQEQEVSFFSWFMGLTGFLARRHPHWIQGVSLLNLVKSLWLYLIQEAAWDRGKVNELLSRDYSGKVKRDLPSFLKGSLFQKETGERAKSGGHVRRQIRHLKTVSPDESDTLGF